MSKNKEGGADLESIAESLDPDKIDAEVGLKHREARNKFKIEDIKVKGYQQFRKTIIDYIKHHHKEVYGSDMPDEMAFGQAKDILDQAYKKEGGKEGGFIQAFKQGSKGNMAEVIDALARQLEGEHTHNYIRNIMHQVDPLDFEGHVKLVEQYLSKYSGSLPKAMKKKSKEQLANDYEALVQHHIGVVDSVRSKVKGYEADKPE
jgi:hypothetical protein